MELTHACYTTFDRQNYSLLSNALFVVSIWSPIPVVLLKFKGSPCLLIYLTTISKFEGFTWHAIRGIIGALGKSCMHKEYPSCVERICYLQAESATMPAGTNLGRP